ncbi:hypothetical protein EJB05_05718 [Eragrostis curvula]|uniref:Protease Do-like PDZ domain-containing protein n=1 Tax=Eragrostis curvula TaxID=38414 RepID=A0A5J9WCX0_9POAL|nr:hypothetical protein EJB05_05718 [Eragrostis curvula]
MTEPGLDPELGEPPAKQRAVDPIAPTRHPWNLPEKFELPQCSSRPDDNVVVIPRDANLPIDAEARRTVARVSLAVVGVASIDVDGDRLWKASGFIVEFDRASMIGTIFSSATVARHDSFYPDIEKIEVYLFDGVSYVATIAACDYHWNLLVLSVSFDRVVKTIQLVEISENMNPRDSHLERLALGPHSTREMLYPGDTVIGLGRQSEEPFGLQGICGIYSIERWSAFPRICQEMQTATFLNTYKCRQQTAIGGPAINRNGRAIGMLFQSVSCTPFLPSNIILRWWEHFKKTGKYCRPTIRVLGVNLHNAPTSPWVKVPRPLQDGSDGFLVELLFENLVENIGKKVDLTVISNEDSNPRSVCLPVEETAEENFYL